MITSPFWRSRTISVPFDTAIVPSSACDGDRYGCSYVPSVVTCVSLDPSGAASQTLWSFRNTIESALDAYAEDRPDAADLDEVLAGARARFEAALDDVLFDLLDDPAAKAILFKYLPAMAQSDQIDMARGMTLKDTQQYAPDMVSDATLAKIDAEFAKLPAKK